MTTQTTSSFRMGPEQTPQALKKLIFLLGGASLLLVLIDPYLVYFGIGSLVQILSLNSLFFTHSYLWQPLTYPFVQLTGDSVPIFFLIHLAFQLYILWFMGADLMERFGKKAFFALFFGSCLFTATIAIVWALLTGSYVLMSGFSPALFSIFVVWTLMYPDATLLLFFVFPVKTKWLLAGVVGGALFLALTGGSLSILSVFCGTFFGYLFSTAGFGMDTPFSFLAKSDRFFQNLGNRIRSYLPTPKESGKIIDLFSGKEHSKEKRAKEDAFMDEMLEKISKSGKTSLSLWERWKMKRISNKRNKTKF